MTLNELLDMQRKLQTHSDAQPTELEHIYLAQADEMGEIIHALKWGMKPVSKHPGWAWWHRDNKPVATRTQVADELADLLCFVLLELIYLQNTESLAIEDNVWQNTWQGSHKDLGYSHAADLWGYLYALNLSVGIETLEWFVCLCVFLGFTQDEIEASYKAAYDKNVARWQAE